MCFFFNDTATTEIYTLSLHDALPIFLDQMARCSGCKVLESVSLSSAEGPAAGQAKVRDALARHPDVTAIRSSHSSETQLDRKSTRLNSSHANISYAVFCLKKNKKHISRYPKIGLFFRKIYFII